MQTAATGVADAEQAVISQTKTSRRPIVLYRRGDKDFARFRMEAQNRVLSIAKRHAQAQEQADVDKAWLQEWTADPTDEFGQLVLAFVEDLERITERPVQYH